MSSKNILVENTEKLIRLKELDSIQLFKMCLPNFKPSKRRCIFLIIMYCTLLTIFKFLSFDNKSAVGIIGDTTTNFNSIIIPIFAIIITGYAIFQALANNLTVKVMMEVSTSDEIPPLIKFNNYFFGIAFIYLALIVINTFLQFIFKYVPDEFHFAFFSNGMNEWLAAILISCYITFVINMLVEMKSFIYNLFQVFLTNASSNIIDILKNGK